MYSKYSTLKKSFCTLFARATVSAMMWMPTTLVIAADEVIVEDAPVEVYSQEQLLKAIQTNKHLKMVKGDDCQLVDDIRARAAKAELPAYQYLWGDMLAWGICVDQDAESGMFYVRQAAAQGLPEALEQLGRYYAQGVFFQQDLKRSVVFLREAASLGNLNAQLQLVDMLSRGMGSPFDYEDAYRWLHNSVIADDNQRQQATMLLTSLAERMPFHIVQRAKKADAYL